MKKTLFVALLTLIVSINTTAQTLFTSTARMYLPASTTFSQGLIDSFNNAVNYQNDIVNGQALTFPDLLPIQLTWNGTAWVAPFQTAITNSFTTPLMASGISHTATATAGATNPSVSVSWLPITGVTQYRFRIRPIGGTWNTSTITGNIRSLTNLQFSTTYEVQIRVYINATTQGEYTNTYTFTTPTFVQLPPCNAPIISESIVGNQLIITWQPIQYATNYFVEGRQIGTTIWGGFTTTNTTAIIQIDSTKAYEYRVRTNCNGTALSFSNFSKLDTITKVLCTPPTNLFNTGNTFNFTPHQYAGMNHIEIRQIGTLNWGGATTTTNFFSNTAMWGQFEWRVRSRCYATTNTGWTNWATATTGWIPKPSTFEQFDSNNPYPNPANDMVYLPGEIVLRDLTGRIIATGTDVLDISQLADGLYFINGQKLQVKH